MSDGVRERWRSTVAAIALAIAASVAVTWPLARELADAVVVQDAACPGLACGDTQLCLWILTEGGRRLFNDPWTLYDAGIFHPMRHTLAYSESGLSLGAMAAPVNALTGNPLLGFNLVYLATFALTGFGVFLVVRRVTGDAVAACLALLMAILAPDRYPARAHVFQLATLWLPFVYHAVLRCLDRPSWGRAVWLAIAVVLHGQAGGYYAVALPLLLGPWVGVLLLSRRWGVRAWSVVLAALAIGGLVTAASYLPHRIVRDELGSPWSGYFPALGAWYWGVLADPWAHLTQLIAGTREPDGASPAPFLLLAAALVVACVTRARPAERAWWWALAAASAVAVTAALLSLGPENPVLAALLWPLQQLVRLIPGLGFARGAMRFRIVVSVATAVVGGIAAAVVLARVRWTGVRVILVLAVTALVVVESRFVREPMSLAAMPEARRADPDLAWLASTPEDTAILAWPGFGVAGAPAHMLAALHHRRPIMNGYSGFVVGFPVVSRFPSAAALATLADAGVRYVIVYEDRLGDDERTRAWLDAVASDPALAPRREGRTLVLTVPPEAGTRDLEPLDPVIPREYWQVVSGQEAAADGDLQTHWVAAASEGDALVRIEFGGVWRLSSVVLELGPHLLEYPRGWLVRGGLHLAKLRKIAREPVAVPPLRSYRADHRRIRVVIPVAPQAVRGIDLRALGPPAPFGIHEIELRGTPIGRPALKRAGASPAPPRP